MSETTIINSKAMQSLLAQSESRLSQTSTLSASSGPTFHQLLEKTVSDDARALTSPASLESSALAAHSPTGSSGERFAHALAAATPAHRLGASLQTSARTLKSPAGAGEAADAHSPSASGTRPAGAMDPKKEGLPDAAAGEDSPDLDATQMKLVNAPALPERPPTAVRESPQLAQARGQADGAAKATPSAGGQTPGVAGATAQTIGAGPRGFAAVLASAHASASTPTSLVDQAGFDPSLHMTVNPQSAHLSLDTGATGALTAQLQITNGVADVHLTGEAAAVLARHGAELSLGLTAAGLQPGRLEITAPTSSADLQSATSDGSGAGGYAGEQAPRDDSHSQPELSGSHKANPATTPASTLSRRVTHVHVKA
jgi:hypothetical protein